LNLTLFLSGGHYKTAVRAEKIGISRLHEINPFEKRGLKHIFLTPKNIIKTITNNKFCVIPSFW